MSAVMMPIVELSIAGLYNVKITVKNVLLKNRFNVDELVVVFY